MVEPKSARARGRALTAVMGRSPLWVIALGSATAAAVVTAAAIVGVDGFWLWAFVVLGWVMAGVVGWGWQR